MELEAQVGRHCGGSGEINGSLGHKGQSQTCHRGSGVTGVPVQDITLAAACVVHWYRQEENRGSPETSTDSQATGHCGLTMESWSEVRNRGDPH